MSTFTVVSYNSDFTPHSIERLSDNQTFTIGEMITNSVGMRGNIKSFSLSKDSSKVFVTTTWSGVGFDLESAQKVQLLPSRFQMHDQVRLRIEQKDYQVDGKGIGQPRTSLIAAHVRGIHFCGKVVKYDLDVDINWPAEATVRMYNVGQSLLSAPTT